MINLTIKTLDSQNHKFVVPDAYNIGELKDFIAEQVKVPAAQQRLIFCGRVLNNGVKLADIGINGKVMHLVQKVPRIATTTSGSSSSTTTNTNSRSGHTTGPGFRGWHTHDPAVLFGAIGIPSEFLQPGELPRLINARNHGTGNRVSLAFDMIRRANDVLNRLENPQSTGLPPANDVGTERPQQAEDTSGSIPPEVSVSESSAPEPSAPESSASDTSAPIIQTDPDSVNVSYEVDETFPNTVVVTIDATHHMRMPPGLMRHMHNHLQQHSNSQTTSQNRTEQTAESEATTVPETTPVGPTNQPPGEQTTGTSIPFAIPEQNSRASQAINDRLRLKDLIDQLNKLNARLQPFYVMYCQYVNEDPHFETAEGENGSLRAQAVFNGVSEVMHNIAHVYHAISDLRVSFQRPPPRSYQSRPCMLQGTILHTAHSVTTTTAAPPSTTQQPTSTQTTTSSQPHVRHYRIDLTQPDGFSETNAPVRTTAATSTETNTDMPIDPRLESNNTTTVFPSNTPHVLELTFDVTPGGNIDSAEAFVTPNASGPSQPTSASQPSSGGETSNNVSMPIDWMDQMIDVISSGVRRPFMSDQSLDWSSIPTTSTRTPRVTPRTTDSSSTTNPPSQGLHRNRWDVTPRMDPFLPCNSHHFESNLRPLVLTRRSTQGTDRSSSSVTGGSSTTDTSNPTSPNEIRPFSTRRLGRPRRSSYIQDADGFISGIRPILSWGRNHRNNTATTSARNNTRATTGQSGGHSVSDSLAGQIRVSMESMFSSFEGEAFERPRNNLPSNITPNPPGAGSESVPVVPRSDICPREMIMDINEIPYFRDLEGQSLLVDMFMLIANNWTLHDIITMNTSNPSSSLVLYPVTRNSDALVNFILDRIMLNQATNSINIEEAGNRIHHELQSCIRIFVNTIFRCSMPMRTNIDVNESVRRCIIQNLRVIVVYCDQVRAGAPNNIVPNLIVFAERLLSLIVYCCNNRAVFRLCIMAVMQFLPLPAQLHNYLTGEVNFLVDQYWDSISSLHMMHLSIVDYIVPHSSDFEAGETSNVSTDEQSSNPILPSSETASDSLSEVVIGSQEWHHNVPSEWVPVIARDSQRQRRQGTQPPYSDAYLSGMPNKRRKIVTSSKPQGPLSQIIAKNMEVAMNAAGVAVNKEITATVGADIDVQSAYAERIRTLGRTGLDTHPDFSPDNYPNASKFFYNHNRPN